MNRAGGSARIFAVVALLTGALAAWLIGDTARSAARSQGPFVTVFVARQPLARGVRIGTDSVGAGVEPRAVPRRFAPADAVTSLDAVDGSILVAGLPAGAYLTAPLLARGAASTGFRLRGGERAVTIEARVAPDGAEPGAGSRVDVFASGLSGGSATSELLAGAEVLAAEGDDGSFRLTLRVAAQQSAMLIRADVFAKEMRAVMRP